MNNEQELRTNVKPVMRTVPLPRGLTGHPAVLPVAKV